MSRVGKNHSCSASPPTPERVFEALVGACAVSRRGKTQSSLDAQLFGHDGSVGWRGRPIHIGHLDGLMARPVSRRDLPCARSCRRFSGRAPMWEMISAAARLPRRPAVSTSGRRPCRRGSPRHRDRRRRWCPRPWRPAPPERDRLAVAQDHAALLRAREHGELGVGLRPPRGVVERAGLVERDDLGFVGEQDVDVGADQSQESAR